MMPDFMDNNLDTGDLDINAILSEIENDTYSLATFDNVAAADGVNRDSPTDMQAASLKEAPVVTPETNVREMVEVKDAVGLAFPMEGVKEESKLSPAIHAEQSLAFAGGLKIDSAYSKPHKSVTFALEESEDEAIFIHHTAIFRFFHRQRLLPLPEDLKPIVNVLLVMEGAEESHSTLAAACGIVDECMRKLQPKEDDEKYLRGEMFDRLVRKLHDSVKALGDHFEASANNGMMDDRVIHDAFFVPAGAGSEDTYAAAPAPKRRRRMAPSESFAYGAAYPEEYAGYASYPHQDDMRQGMMAHEPRASAYYYER
ncbi:MAG: hypothetical protein SGILL_009778 [Bacillariaceae sp.]